ncbi:uncharacterized protein MEPE_06389 [Melanopsichium pennsylvanicum]|uniref:Uncharacterized protein n=1 Tax=Melanopsichium pennsylvanicum TaxID=63383 RepID=A0AAJ4XSB3_9BASI|nr:uncharacterized protein MEPE_06389 [Melanopsichium pennsylvanicum]
MAAKRILTRGAPDQTAGVGERPFSRACSAAKQILAVVCVRDGPGLGNAVWLAVAEKLLKQDCQNTKEEAEKPW